MEKVIYFTRKVSCCCGNLHIKLGCNKKRVCEVSLELRNSDQCKRSCAEATGKLITLILRNEFNPVSIINRADIGAVICELEEAECHTVIYDGEKLIPSCAQAVSRVLKTYL